ncbi:PIG-L family deacetylase [Promicromonospora soli]
MAARTDVSTAFPPPAVRRLLVVCSHPFDATFALGGVIGAFVRAGTHVRIVCLTHGRRPDDGARRAARATELLDAARRLGVEEVSLLDHRAGHLQGNTPEWLASELRAVAGQVDALLTIDARAPGSHPDHVRAMRTAQHAAAELHCPLYGWVRRTWDAGDEPADVIAVDCDRARQRSAISCHESSPPSDDPIRELPRLDETRDFLTVVQQGLASSEPPGSGHRREADDMEIVRGQREAQEVMGLHESVRMDELGDFFPRAMTAAGEALAARGVTPAGPPVALYQGMAEEKFDVTAGFPVPAGAAPSGDVVVATLPGGATVEAIHQGSYDGLSSTYEELTAWFKDNGMTPPTVMWEEYLVGPESEADPSHWQTRIVYPMG